MDQCNGAQEYVWRGALAKVRCPARYGAGTCDSVDGDHHPGQIVQLECGDSGFAEDCQDWDISVRSAPLVSRIVACVSRGRAAFTQLGCPGYRARPNHDGAALPNSC